MKHKLLLAVDGGKTSGRTASYVARACTGTRQPIWGLVLFHVLPELPKPDETQIVRPEERDCIEARTRELAQQMLAALKEQLVREGVEPRLVSTVVAEERGNEVSQILRAGEDYDCDTIIVGRREGSMIGKYFAGSVAEKLLRNPTGFSLWVVE